MWLIVLSLSPHIIIIIIIIIISRMLLKPYIWRNSTIVKKSPCDVVVNVHVCNTVVSEFEL